jgi:hypothetical protein
VRLPHHRPSTIHESGVGSLPRPRQTLPGVCSVSAGGAGSGGGSWWGGLGGAGVAANSLACYQEGYLVGVAAAPFRQKHLWFLEQVGKLQLPWSDGHIRLVMVVRRF